MPRALLALLLAATLAGCAHAPSEPPPAPGTVLTVKGTLQKGAECPEIRTADRRVFALSGPLGDYAPGDAVCLRGRVVELSFCMAGIATLAIEDIGPPGGCP